MSNKILLFIMPGCSVCPQMERLFEELHERGDIDELEVLDNTIIPDLAGKYNIKTVPFYLINGIAFNGLKTREEVVDLLQQDDSQKWISLIRAELIDGQLELINNYIQKHEAARVAMMELLADTDTELVVRIGLTAIIESLAAGDLLDSLEERFIQMTRHNDERIALDALYYLSLLSSPSSLAALTNVARNGKPGLREDARELLAERMTDRVLH